MNDQLWDVFQLYTETRCIHTIRLRMHTTCMINYMYNYFYLEKNMVKQSKLHSSQVSNFIIHVPVVGKKITNEE